MRRLAGRSAPRAAAAMLVLAAALRAEPAAAGGDGDAAEDGREEVSAAAASADSARREDGGARFFKTWEAALEAGMILPQGDLAEVLDPAPLLGLRVTTSYYRSWRAAATLSGSLLDGPDSPTAVAWIAGAAGLERRASRPWIPVPGLALALYYVRAAGEDDAGDEYLFLEDGESEFGLQGSLRWILPLSGSLGLEAGVRWDMMFTNPAYTHAATLAAGAAWTP